MTTDEEVPRCFACSYPAEGWVRDIDGETKPACAMHADMVNRAADTTKQARS